MVPLIGDGADMPLGEQDSPKLKNSLIPVGRAVGGSQCLEARLLKVVCCMEILAVVN